MSGRATRRRGVRADRVKRQRAGIKRLNEAFGWEGQPVFNRGAETSYQRERRAGLLASLGFGTRQRKGDES